MPQLFALHLVPGLLTTLAWVLLAPPLMARGYPSLFALLLATAGVLIPLELGYPPRPGKAGGAAGSATSSSSGTRCRAGS